MDRIGHSNEPLGIEVDFRVVASADFAETREVKSELVQQGSQRYRDQDLRMGTEMAHWSARAGDSP